MRQVAEAESTAVFVLLFGIIKRRVDGNQRRGGTCTHADAPRHVSRVILPLEHQVVVGFENPSTQGL